MVKKIKTKKKKTNENKIYLHYSCQLIFIFYTLANDNFFIISFCFFYLFLFFTHLHCVQPTVLGRDRFRLCKSSH